MAGNLKGKKSKMRTSSDVASRLLWDECLPKEDFVVGYLDRFKGIMEEKFISFDWGDPAAVDNFTLAIPKHRIQYFKYKNKKVWDKNSRLDIMFGSTGDNRNIQDFIKEVDNMDKIFFDEGILSDEVSEDEQCSIKEDIAYDNSNRSNFFIAVRITDPDILENLNELRGLILLKDESLEECCMSNAEYHVTLLTIRLDSLEEIHNAVDALKSIKKTTELPTIELEGLDIFRHRVLYSIIKYDDTLTKLRENLIQCFSRYNINMLDKFNFVPHVTVMKLSRPTIRIRHSKFIEPYLYVDFENKYFGSQLVNSLTLCEMGSNRREDGFYQSAVEIDLSKAE